MCFMCESKSKLHDPDYKNPNPFMGTVCQDCEEVKFFIDEWDTISVTLENLPNLIGVGPLHRSAEVTLRNLPKVKFLFPLDEETGALTLEKMNIEHLPPAGNLACLTLVNLPHLKKVAEFNRLEELYLRDLPVLEEVDVTFRNADVISIRNLPNLKKVTIKGSARTISLCHLPQLEVVEFSNVQLQHLQLNNLPKITRVRSTDLEVMDLTIINLPRLLDVPVIPDLFSGYFKDLPAIIKNPYDVPGMYEYVDCRWITHKDEYEPPLKVLQRRAIRRFYKKMVEAKKRIGENLYKDVRDIVMNMLM